MERWHVLHPLLLWSTRQNAAHGQGVTNEMLQKIDEKVSEFTSDNKLTGNIPADAEAIFNGLEIDNKDSLKNELIDKITEKLTPVSTGTSLNTGGKAKRSKKSAKKGKKSRGMKGKRGRRSAKKGRK